MSNVWCALLRGLTKTWPSLDGSMSLPGPTTISAVPRTCWRPFGVRSSSVVPVYRPFLLHSVWPLRGVASVTGSVSGPAPVSTHHALQERPLGFPNPCPAYLTFQKSLR